MVTIAAIAGALWSAAAPAAVITIGSAVGAAGGDVTVAVTLQTEGGTILATQNRIDFERSAPIAARTDGEPDCAVNAAIDKNATGFRFLPLDCDPAVDCASLRVFVIAFDNLKPIADGAQLYTCRVAIPPATLPGSYPLRNSETMSSAPGGVLVATTGVDGEVEVLASSPTPTLTPTTAPTSTSLPSATPTETPTGAPPCVGDCDGNRMVAINELLTGVNISNGAAPLSLCEVFDADHDGSLVINELIQGVNRALNGCPT